MDWIASFIGLSGCFLLGSGHRIGWLCYAVASGINAYLGFQAGFAGMAAGCTCYVALELRGWYNSKINNGKGKVNSEKTQ